MSDAEMRGIVLYGDAFLPEYVGDLLEAERARDSRSGSTLADR